MRAAEAALESAFGKIARIISKQYGVTVRVQGSRAGIDLETKTIVLPSLSSDVVKGFEEILDGLLDHEVAHALFTDIASLPEVSDTLHQLHNALEDPMVERRMSAKFVGCGENLHLANTILKRRVADRWLSMDPWGRLLTAISFTCGGYSKVEDYETDPKIGALVLSLSDLLEKGKTTKTTAETLAVAREILERIGSQKEGDGSGDEDDEEAADERRMAADSGPGGGEPEDEGGEASPAAGAEASAAEPGDADGAEEAGAADGSPQPGLEASEGDGVAPGGEGPGEEPKPSPEAAKQAEKILQQIRDGIAGQQQTLEGLVNQEIDKILRKPDGEEPDSYLVFSEAFDTELVYTTDQRVARTSEYAKLKARVAQYIGAMAGHLELALLAQAESRWVGGELRGKRFDRKRLSAWTMGSDDERIFRIRVDGERLDTAVTMLWDCSGSMGSASNPGSKAALARIAAIAFHEALERVQVPHEVLGFNTGGGQSKELIKLSKAATANGDDMKRFSRVSELDKRMVFVPFGSHDGRAICAINGGSANRDGECVLWAARRLAARPEGRKILIVGSDGQPAGARYGNLEARYLAEVVQKVQKAGIEVFGLGIKDSSVKHYYPHWAVVQEIEQLPRAVMAQLIRHLVGPVGMDR